MLPDFLFSEYEVEPNIMESNVTKTFFLNFSEAKTS
jgi:hypothetical protein